ncbi:hypothetical protein E2C01_071619 [Portunus trituberculatus]|uniref:Uncharacterized protein n=1 Tax=Portunus trituberculatus TaxID=210409 RepID=A0A5B7I0D7_PORTR|nr:hypothetical protein [Portunus trituberculatus]
MIPPFMTTTTTTTTTTTRPREAKRSRYKSRRNSGAIYCAEYYKLNPLPYSSPLPCPHSLPAILPVPFLAPLPAYPFQPGVAWL